MPQVLIAFSKVFRLLKKASIKDNLIFALQQDGPLARTCVNRPGYSGPRRESAL